MLNNTKKVLSVLVALIILLSSVSVVWSVYAAGTDVKLELNGGTLQNISSDFNKGDILPDYEQVKKDGAVFGGWYTNPDFSGERVYIVPSDLSGDIIYYACWIIPDSNFENFDSYSNTDALMAKWGNWTWPETNANVSLNTDANHALNSNNSFKISFNKANANANILKQNVNYSKMGDGVAFWIESTNGATVKIRFNNNASLESQPITVPTGKHIVTIPWNKIPNALTTAYLWQTNLIVSAPNAGDAVYIDDIGTYSKVSDYKITFNKNGGVWSEGYQVPEECFANMSLPTMDNIKRDGLAFAGWYDNAEFTGSPVDSVGDVFSDREYWAKWINLDAGFENFDSYGTTENMMANWVNWTWPEKDIGITLNTDKNHALSGKNSLKFVFNKVTTATSFFKQNLNFDKSGEGIAFWIESTSGATVKIKFNDKANLTTQEITVSAGKHIVTISWDQIPDALTTAYLWKTQLIVKAKNVNDVVYIDDIGTYFEHVDSGVTFETNGGSWVGDYTVPETIETGMALPSFEHITKDGANFGGWYTNSDFSGERVYTVPSGVLGDITYYAHWLILDSNFENFDSYSNTDALMGKWVNWTWPESNANLALNTDVDHALSGNNSFKISFNKDNVSTNILKKLDYSKIGDGIAFWVESTSGATVKIKFNNSGSLESKPITVPAGKHIVTIPWDKIPNALTTAYLWQTNLIVSAPKAGDVVYIDDIGTYGNFIEFNIDFKTNGGSWVGDYTPPTKSATGKPLPTIDKIEREGFVFAGWYDNAAFEGKPVYSVPGSVMEDVTYHACWIKYDVTLSDFEHITDTSAVTSVDEKGNGDTKNDKTNGFINGQSGGFYFWGGVEGSTAQINIDGKYAVSGNKSAKLVLKSKVSTTLYNSTVFGSNSTGFKADKDHGEGISFWIKTDKDIKLSLRINGNKELAYAIGDIPAGEHYITVPWVEVGNDKNPWSTMLYLTNPTEETTVYIDDIGTYTVAVDNKIKFNTNGGSWIEKYAPPTGYFASSELVLPNCNQLKNESLGFAGWYNNKELKGSPVYSIDESANGDKEYWAKWIVLDVNFDNFDSYDTDADMLNPNHWTVSTEKAALNNSSAQAYNGKNSIKISFSKANSITRLVNSRNSYPKTGDGIAFWLDSTHGAKVKFSFNGGAISQSEEISVWAGKRVVTIPWSLIPGALNSEKLLQTTISISVPKANDVVYIDEIGTYKEDVKTANNIDLYRLNGTWDDNYTVPTKYASSGVILPTYKEISLPGYVFAGWYDNKEFSGEVLTVTPAGGELKLYPKWVKNTTEFDNFESYADTASLGWNACNEMTAVSLNTKAVNAYNSSKSLKIEVAAKGTHNYNNAVVSKEKAFAKKGDGISFWIKSEISTKVGIAFNDSQDNYYSVNIPAGKSFVTIPWVALENICPDDVSKLFILLETYGNSVTNTVYIDEIGTYTNSTHRVLKYNLNGGTFAQDATIPFEMEAGDITLLPTDTQVIKEGAYFAGWYDNAEFTGVPMFCLDDDDMDTREFWAKWVEQVNINYSFENFEDQNAFEKSAWQEAKTYDNGWRSPDSVKLFLEEDSKNLAPNSIKGLRAEYEIKPGEYLQYGDPCSIFRNVEWNTTVGKRGTYREGDGFRFWIKSDKTVTMNASFLIGGAEKAKTKSTDFVIPASDNGVIVYLPWSYIQDDEATLVVYFGMTIYGELGDKGNVWIDDLGIYYNEKLEDYLVFNDDKDIKILGHENHIPKGTGAQIKKYKADYLESLGGSLPKDSSFAYLAEYKLINNTGGIASLGGPAWVSFKIPAGADVSKMGIYEVFFDGMLTAMNFTVEGDWITTFTFNSNGMLLVTMNDDNWVAYGPSIDENVVQNLTVSTVITKPDEDTEDDLGAENDDLAFEEDENDDSTFEDDESDSKEDNNSGRRPPKRRPLKTNENDIDTNGNFIWIIIVVGIVLLVATGITVFILIKRRQRKNNGGTR